LQSQIFGAGDFRVASVLRSTHSPKIPPDGQIDSGQERHLAADLSAMLGGKDEDLAGMNEIWIADAVAVCSIYDRVLFAGTIGDAADAPQAVAAGDGPR
jgi:hypothetical protein